jgi:hypothetical protein
MNQNSVWNNPPHPVETPQYVVERLQVSQVIVALEKKYAANAMALAMLGAISKKIQEVPTWVQNMVAELLKQDLVSKISNTALVTAVIEAMNPQKTISSIKIPEISVAANTEKYQKAA